MDTHTMLELERMQQMLSGIKMEELTECNGTDDREHIATHILLIFTIFLRENLQVKRNMSNFADGFLKRLSYKDIKLREKLSF